MSRAALNSFGLRAVWTIKDCFLKSKLFYFNGSIGSRWSSTSSEVGWFSLTGSGDGSLLGIGDTGNLLLFAIINVGLFMMRTLLKWSYLMLVDIPEVLRDELAIRELIGERMSYLEAEKNLASSFRSLMAGSFRTGRLRVGVLISVVIMTLRLLV